MVLSDTDMVSTDVSQTAGASYIDYVLQDESVPIPIMGQDAPGDAQQVAGDTMIPQQALDPMDLQGVFQQSTAPIGPEPLTTSGNSDVENPIATILPSPPIQPSDPKKARLDSDPTSFALNTIEQEEKSKEEWLDL